MVLQYLYMLVEAYTAHLIPLMISSRMVFAHPVDVNITAITNPFNVTLPNSAMISCTASGFPQPVITWLIPGGTGPIQSGNSPNGITINETIPIASPGNLPPRLSSILTISSSMRVHNGTYTCTATSMSTPATTATATTDLTVLGKHWHGAMYSCMHFHVRGCENLRENLLIVLMTFRVLQCIKLMLIYLMFMRIAAPMEVLCSLEYFLIRVNALPFCGLIIHAVTNSVLVPNLLVLYFGLSCSTFHLAMCRGA